MINWADPKCPVTTHFCVKDCLWLPKWNRLANASDGLTEQLQDTLFTFCQKLEEVRAVIYTPMNIHSIYRPPAYSPLVGGTATDVHTQGIAADFDCEEWSLTCDNVKQILLPKLIELDIRMEDNGPGAAWVHVDTHPVGHLRFFKP